MLDRIVCLGLAALLVGAALGFILMPVEPSAAASSEVAAPPADDRERFALDLLRALGNYAPSPDIVAFVVEWTVAEDHSDGALARNNPLNTTMCGYNMLGKINDDGACGVQTYATYQDGLDATAATLAQANFAEITYALQTNDARGAFQALIASDWAASHYGGGADWPKVSAARAFAPTDDRERFAFDLLRALGNDAPSAETVALVVAWENVKDRSDGALSRNNPLNMTQTGFNGDGVKGYATYEDGLAATVQTLAPYAEIVAGLQTNDPERALRGMYASPWGTDMQSVEIIWRQETRPQYAGQTSAAVRKHPVTDNMAVGANFYDTGSDAWAGQYNHMHLGTDYLGEPGVNVYAPFDCTFDQTGFYEDEARWGHFLICYFSDGTLFYAGHLQDVIQPAQGDVIPAGTIIGHIGQLYHTHIKLSPPGAPQPCEGSGTCEDFEQYYREH